MKKIMKEKKRELINYIEKNGIYGIIPFLIDAKHDIMFCVEDLETYPVIVKYLYKYFTEKYPGLI